MDKTKSNLNYQRFLKDVEKIAYQLFLKRSETNTKGDAVSDWLKAEVEMRTIIKNKLADKARLK